MVHDTRNTELMNTLYKNPTSKLRWTTILREQFFITDPCELLIPLLLCERSFLLIFYITNLLNNDPKNPPN